MGYFKSRSLQCKTGETVVIRSATQADANRINQLAQEVFRTSQYLVTQPDEFPSPDENEQRARIARFEVGKNDVLLVADTGNEIVGMLDFHGGKKRRIAHKGVFGISVHPHWQNKGIGRLLLSSLIEWVKEHPTVEVINLNVMEENKPAIALYSKLGFEVIGREPYGIKLGNGQYMADLMMSLRVEKSPAHT